MSEEEEVVLLEWEVLRVEVLAVGSPVLHAEGIAPFPVNVEIGSMPAEDAPEGYAALGIVGRGPVEGANNWAFETATSNISGPRGFMIESPTTIAFFPPLEGPVEVGVVEPGFEAMELKEKDPEIAIKDDAELEIGDPGDEEKTDQPDPGAPEPSGGDGGGGDGGGGGEAPHVERPPQVLAEEEPDRPGDDEEDE